METYEGQADLRAIWQEEWIAGRIPSGNSVVDELQRDSVNLELDGDLEGAQTMHSHALRVLGMTRRRGIGYAPRVTTSLDNCDPIGPEYDPARLD